MIPMNNWPTEAVNKLAEGRKNVKGQKAAAMAGAVYEALKDFCLQDAEFAQAVVQGGSFPDCMNAVAKSVGQSISDIEAYSKAVAFYFPGAKIRVQMSIDLIGDETHEEPELINEEAQSAGIVLSLLDF